ncbi:hypothetical protein V6N12_045376 [Hibiscus sabdariffa]|uniref:Chromatin target of PRMT1 protein C-terminal domain-containing protein n=1 Tax=Hibiscus sabdariffa TaxID=183260 RepID=A0ABR2G2T7_9ROSI
MPVPTPPTKSSILRAPNVASRRDQERTGGRGWVRGGGNGPPNLGGASHGFALGHGHGRGRGGLTGKKLSAEDLDADLDKYHLDATRIK